MEINKVNDVHVISDQKVVGYKQRYIFMSDIHFDSKYCNRKLFKEHLDYAKKNNARILIFGDFFDCMGGKYDKRSSKKDIMPEYQVEDYFDAIVTDAYKFLEPYKDNILFIAVGNHETSVLARHEINLISRLTELLDCKYGEYSGFIRFKFERYNQKKKKTDGARESKLLYYTHGSGGNSVVTKGVISTNRRQVSIEADYYVSGHNHNEFIVPLTIATVTDGNIIKVVKKLHFNLGTYKTEWGISNFSQQKGFAPENIGCVELEFYYHLNNIKARYRMLE